MWLGVLGFVAGGESLAMIASVCWVCGSLLVLGSYVYVWLVVGCFACCWALAMVVVLGCFGVLWLQLCDCVVVVF